MQTIKKVLAIHFALSCVIVSTQCSFAATEKSTGDSVFSMEKPQIAPMPEKPLLQGKASQSELDGYAKTTSSVPLLKGSVVQALPQQWQGLWQGGVQLNELHAHATANTPLEGSVVNLQLKLEAAQSGTKVYDLSVHQLASQANDEGNKQRSQTTIASGNNEPDPDIHFWHEGNHSHLLIKNGASMTLNGNLVLGAAPGTDTTMVITGQGSHVGGDPGNNNQGLPSYVPERERGGMNYNDGGIVMSGPATFKGQYFKSDDQMAVKNAQIQTNRIDIGNQTTMTHGTPMNLSGSGSSGYLLTKLMGSGRPTPVPTSTITPPPVHQHPRGPITLVGPQSKLLSLRMVKIAPGIFDVETVSKLDDSDGGTRQVVTRYTALEPGRMVVQMSIRNFDNKSTLTASFNASGYVYR